MSEELGVRGMSVLEDKVEGLATLFEKEERLARLEGAVEQMDKRLASVEDRLNHTEIRLEELREEIIKNFRWTIGTTLFIPMWVTILAIILK